MRGLVTQSWLTLCSSMDCQVPRPWDFPGENTGVGCHLLLQGIFPTEDWTPVTCAAGRFFTIWATREVLFTCKFYPYIPQNCRQARHLSLGESLQGPLWANLSTHNKFWLHPWPWVLKSAKGPSAGDWKAERNNCWGATTGLAQYLVLSHPLLQHHNHSRRNISSSLSQPFSWRKLSSEKLSIMPNVT